MMSSYIVRSRSLGHHLFNDRVPTIFDIQEYIENAWDQGINSQGRIETGGIRGTRKYIGTPDVSILSHPSPATLSQTNPDHRHKRCFALWEYSILLETPYILR